MYTDILYVFFVLPFYCKLPFLALIKYKFVTVLLLKENALWFKCIMSFFQYCHYKLYKIKKKDYFKEQTKLCMINR